jgi:putative oxidoreductase
MKKLLRVNKSSEGINIAILVTRITIALLMLVHGIPKMGMLFAGNAELFPAVMGLSSTLSLSLTVFAEVFCSVLILAGLGTRLAVGPLAITMLVAIFLVLANDPFTSKELAVHYLFTYIVLFITGSGKYSLDYLLRPNETRHTYTPAKVEDPTLSIYQ